MTEFNFTIANGTDKLDFTDQSQRLPLTHKITLWAGRDVGR